MKNLLLKIKYGTENVEQIFYEKNGYLGMKETKIKNYIGI